MRKGLLALAPIVAMILLLIGFSIYYGGVSNAPLLIIFVLASMVGVVLTRGKQPSDALKKEIQDYVKSRTAPYKYPRIVEFRTELPKTISGKIIRNQL